MAYTKIKAIKNNLGRCLDYTSNPKKTKQFSGEDLSRLLNYTQNTDKTEHQLYVAGFNCDPENALEVMQSTKRRWKKDGENHVQGYHLIQSFKPGEVTPEQAFEIGCEFARRYLADRYEVTVSTHLDRAHLHSHIVFNSVTFRDGTMFRNSFNDYYNGIRKISDELCREHGLTVIRPDGKGRQYAEWNAEQSGQLTVRGMVRQDVERVLQRSINWEIFVIGLKKQGYQLKCGPGIKYAAIRQRESERWIRLKSLGPEYTEQAIRDRLAQQHFVPQAKLVPALNAPQAAEPAEATARQPGLLQNRKHHSHARFRGRFPLQYRQKITGFMALYYHYLYLLGKAKKGHTSKRTYYLLREDFRRFDRYAAQSKYLWRHHIQTDEELSKAKAAAEATVKDLTRQRAQLYKRRDTAIGSDKEALSRQIQRMNDRLRECRKEVSLCDDIQADAARLRQRLTEAERAERKAREQPEKHRNFEKRNQQRS